MTNRTLFRNNRSYIFKKDFFFNMGREITQPGAGNSFGSTIFPAKRASKVSDT